MKRPTLCCCIPRPTSSSTPPTESERRSAIAYKILRPGGREYGYAYVPFNSHSKVTSLHGWCIPAQGKDYEVKDKDAVEASPPMVEGSELVVDVKVKVLKIPAADPGSIVGYEYEKRNSLTPCRIPGIFNAKFPRGSSATPCSFPLGGSSKRRGCTILK